MDVGCWGVISDHLSDYCCQVGSLKFQHLDADFSTSETCFTGDKLYDVVLNHYFGENN